MCQWFQRKGTVRKLSAQEHKYQGSRLQRCWGKLEILPLSTSSGGGWGGVCADGSGGGVFLAPQKKYFVFTQHSISRVLPWKSLRSLVRLRHPSKNCNGDCGDGSAEALLPRLTTGVAPPEPTRCPSDPYTHSPHQNQMERLPPLHLQVENVILG